MSSQYVASQTVNLDLRVKSSEASLDILEFLPIPSFAAPPNEFSFFGSGGFATNENLQVISDEDLKVASIFVDESMSNFLGYDDATPANEYQYGGGRLNGTYHITFNRLASVDNPSVIASSTAEVYAYRALTSDFSEINAGGVIYWHVKADTLANTFYDTKDRDDYVANPISLKTFGGVDITAPGVNIYNATLKITRDGYTPRSISSYSLETSGAPYVALDSPESISGY